jgi:hypothetical protein
MRTPNYESDDEAFPADAYRVRGYNGVAWHVLGWETEPIAEWFCGDCGRSGYERDGGGGAITDPGDPECEHEAVGYSDEQSTIRTERVVAIMIGDDRRFTFDADDLVEPLAREAYCGECGQIGCAHDGLDKSDSD